MDNIQRGIFDGFEGYRTAADDDYDRVLKSGLVVLDTSTLLNLYRYNAAARQSMIDVLTAIGENLWVPHQVMREFWRNRERSLLDPGKDVTESVKKLNELRDSSREIISQWRKRAALTDTVADTLTSTFETAFTQACLTVESAVDVTSLNRAINTANDEVLKLLEPALEGRVGEPLSLADHESAVNEGKRRAEAGEPPGFGDLKKADRGDDSVAGDYLVWEQILREAATRERDVLLVTGDVNKGDWWRLERGTPRGPRNELVQELRLRAGTWLYMMRPEALLEEAGRVFAVDVKEESLQDVVRVERTFETSWSTEAAGWTRATVEVLLRRLRSYWPVQATVIELAISNGGFVGRDEVYLVGDYPPDRQLKGFTRPVNRLVQEMRDSGEIGEDAPDLLQPVYDEMSRGFGWADGFRVPDEVVTLFQ